MTFEDSFTWIWGGRIGMIKVSLQEDPKETYMEALVGHRTDLTLFLAEEGWEGMAQYVNGLRTSALIMYLVFMTVREDLSRKGIGTAMMARMLKMAKEMGVKKVLLQRDSNSRASDQVLARFYRKFGFADIKIQNQEEDDPMPAMALTLR